MQRILTIAFLCLGLHTLSCEEPEDYDYLDCYDQQEACVEEMLQSVFLSDYIDAARSQYCYCLSDAPRSRDDAYPRDLCMRGGHAEIIDEICEGR